MPKQCQTCKYANLDRQNEHGEIRCKRFLCYTRLTDCCNDYKRKFDKTKAVSFIVVAVIITLMLILPPAVNVYI